MEGDKKEYKKINGKSYYRWVRKDGTPIPNRSESFWLEEVTSERVPYIKSDRNY